MRTPQEIFHIQSTISALDGASDMLEDFAARCILAGHNKEDTVKAVGEHYRQCEEVAERKYIQGLRIAAKNS